jgi:Adenylate and Guanylate cyclase catalytic domain
VLRGERSRFQLFGDTVNYAAIMEGTGKRDRIQISQETADLLIQGGKTSWFSPRLDHPEQEGKPTYWLKVNNEDPLEKGSGHSRMTDKSENAYNMASNLTQNAPKISTSVLKDPSVIDIAPSFVKTSSHDVIRKSTTAEKTTRLIEWNAEVLIRILKEVVARRGVIQRRNSGNMANHQSLALRENEIMNPIDNETVLDEVKEIIQLPEYDSLAARNDQSVETIELGSKVEEQLRAYLLSIGTGYRDNPFHNFEHASHVTMVRVD